MTDIVPSWKWGHGELIIERLVAESDRKTARGEKISERPRPKTKDRYYLQARKIAAIMEYRKELFRLNSMAVA